MTSGKMFSFVLIILCIAFSEAGSCNNPPPISGGTSEVVRNVVTYTCNTGYAMNGIANNVSCFNSSWIGEPPKCILQKQSINMNNNPKVYNSFHLQAVPKWLLYLIASVGGCACLLLLCCTLAVCLRCLGCWGTVKGVSGEHGCFYCCCRRNVDEVIHMEEASEPKKKISTTSLPPEYTAVEKKKAKKPTNTWMPHHNEVRPFNTSTK